jgi:hypothetical protein
MTLQDLSCASTAHDHHFRRHGNVVTRETVMPVKTSCRAGCFGIGLFWAMCLIVIPPVMPAPASASESSEIAPMRHPIVGGIRHQPTTAEMMETGRSDLVDTSPEVGAEIDELMQELTGHRPAPSTSVPSASVGAEIDAIPLRSQSAR